MAPEGEAESPETADAATAPDRRQALRRRLVLTGFYTIDRILDGAYWVIGVALGLGVLHLCGVHLAP